MVAIASNIIAVSSETLNHVTDVARVPLLLEEQAATLHLKEQNYSVIQENVGISTIRIHEPTAQSDVTFGTFTEGQSLENENFRLSESNTGFLERFTQSQPRATITLSRYILRRTENGRSIFVKAVKNYKTFLRRHFSS